MVRVAVGALITGVFVAPPGVLVAPPGVFVAPTLVAVARWRVAVIVRVGVGGIVPIGERGVREGVHVFVAV